MTFCQALSDKGYPKAVLDEIKVVNRITLSARADGLLHQL